MEHRDGFNIDETVLYAKYTVSSAVVFPHVGNIICLTGFDKIICAVRRILFMEVRAHMIVYADILFLVDASMDIASLWLCARLFHRRCTTWRMLAAATVGGLGSVLLLFLPYSGTGIFLFGIFLSAAITGIAFGYKNFIPVWSAVWGTGTLMGGVMTLLMRLGQPVYVASDFTDYSILYAVAVGICCAFIRLWRGKRTTSTARLYIRHGEWHTDVVSLVDSGNLATDPLSGVPVVFVSASCAPDFPLVDSLMSSECPAWLRKTLRIIPLRTLQGEGCVTGFLAEECIVDGKSCRAVVVIERVGAQNYGGYGALCPASLCR